MPQQVAATAGGDGGVAATASVDINDNKRISNQNGDAGSDVASHLTPLLSQQSSTTTTTSSKAQRRRGKHNTEHIYENLPGSGSGSGSGSGVGSAEQRLLRKYFRREAIYENLCRGCGYGVFAAQGPYCHFCQCIVGGVAAVTPPIATPTTPTSSSDCNIYENICEQCRGIYSDQESCGCAAPKAAATATPTSTATATAKSRTLLSYSKSSASATLTRRGIFQGLFGSLKQLNRSSSSKQLRLFQRSGEQSRTGGGSLEIIHNVDEVFRTQETFDLRRICELKRIQSSRSEQHIYGRLKCQAPPSEREAEPVELVPEPVKSSASKKPRISRIRLLRNGSAKAEDTSPLASPLASTPASTATSTATSLPSLYLNESICQWMATLRRELHSYEDVGSGALCQQPKSVPAAHEQRQWRLDKVELPLEPELAAESELEPESVTLRREAATATPEQRLVRDFKRNVLARIGSQQDKEKEQLSQSAPQSLDRRRCGINERHDSAFVSEFLSAFDCILAKNREEDEDEATEQQQLESKLETAKADLPLAAVEAANAAWQPLRRFSLFALLNSAALAASLHLSVVGYDKSLSAFLRRLRGGSSSGGDVGVGAERLMRRYRRCCERAAESVALPTLSPLSVLPATPKSDDVAGANRGASERQRERVDTGRGRDVDADADADGGSSSSEKSGRDSDGCVWMAASKPCAAAAAAATATAASDDGDNNNKSNNNNNNNNNARSKVKRPAPQVPVRNPSTSLSHNQPHIASREPPEANIKSKPHRAAPPAPLPAEQNNNKIKVEEEEEEEEEEESIYQPIWQMKTVGVAQEHYEAPLEQNSDDDDDEEADDDVDDDDDVSRAADAAAAASSDDDDDEEAAEVAEALTKLSPLASPLPSPTASADQGAWETDDEFMFATQRQAEEAEEEEQQLEPAVELDTLSVGSTVTNTNSTATLGSLSSCGSQQRPNPALAHELLRNICILYSPAEPKKWSVIIYDYQRAHVHERFQTRVRRPAPPPPLPTQAAQQPPASSNDDSGCSCEAEPEEQQSRLPGESADLPGNCDGDVDIDAIPLPMQEAWALAVLAAASAKRGGVSRGARKLRVRSNARSLMPQPVLAWRELLQDVNCCEDEEDMIVPVTDIRAQQIQEDNNEVQQQTQQPPPTILQRFKSASIGNLVDLPGEDDKKSIKNRMRMKLNSNVFRINRSPKSEKKSRQRRGQVNSLYLDEQSKYPLFAAPLNALELNMTDHPNVPRFVVDVCAYIERPECIEQDGLYRASGNKLLVDELKKKLTHLYEPRWLQTDDIHTLTSLHKQFFRELATPLITQEAYERLGRNLTDNAAIERMKAAFDEMPEPNRSTLRFLIKHLTNVAAASASNRMPASNLAIVWGPCLLAANQIQFDIGRMNMLAKVLIENYDRIFRPDNERLVC